jgi:CheY-like chemotaxis protein
MAKILVVDDEPDMIWAITNVLLSENHSVVSVNSGEEALQKVRETPLDLVLLDFRLPGMDGIQILENIRQIKPGLPVVMVTGYGGIEEAVQAIKLGAAHYIAKPFENDHLVEIVNKSLQLDSLKKEGVFGKRAVEKIDPRLQNAKPNSTLPPVAPPPAPQPPVFSNPPEFSPEPVFSAPSSSKTRWAAWIAGSLLSVALLAGGAFYWLHRGGSNRVYSVPDANVSGLSWGGDYLWSCDWFTQTVYQYQPEEQEMRVIRTFPLKGMHLTGIAWSAQGLYTCDSWKKTISRHRLDSSLTVAETVPSPGPNPSGLFFDGKYLWSCDGTTRKIYQHALDDQLTVLSTYDSPGVFPVGLFHDQKDFWSASATGMKIYRNDLTDRFKLVKAYIFPDSGDIGQQISAFTLGKNRIWIAYERVNKLYEKQIQDLQETQP